MGQARKRGTREDRIQQAIERRHEEEQARAIVAEATRRQYAQWFDSLTPEEQETERRRQSEKARRRARTAAFVALSLGLGGWDL